MCQSHKLGYESIETTNIRLEVGWRQKVSRNVRDVRWGDLIVGKFISKFGRSTPIRWRVCLCFVSRSLFAYFLISFSLCSYLTVNDSNCIYWSFAIKDIVIKGVKPSADSQTHPQRVGWFQLDQQTKKLPTFSWLWSCWYIHQLYWHSKLQYLSIKNLPDLSENQKVEKIAESEMTDAVDISNFLLQTPRISGNLPSSLDWNGSRAGLMDYNHGVDRAGEWLSREAARHSYRGVYTHGSACAQPL